MKIGQIITVRGIECRVIISEGAGTYVVESLDGRYYFRVSGYAMSA